MAKVAVFIHGMGGTPDVSRNWRPLVEARDWRTIAPFLRYHDAPTLVPPAGLGTTSLGNYVADITETIESLAENPALIGDSTGGLLALQEALSHNLSTTDRGQATELHSAFVHDRGRALFEIALLWLDGRKTTTVDVGDMAEA